MHHINKYTQYKAKVSLDQGVAVLAFKPMVKNINGSFFIPKQ